MTGFESGSVDSGEVTDSDSSPAARREAIETRLAREVPADASLGKLAGRAEALADARDLSTAHPKQVGALVPAISQTMAGVAATRWSKGSEYLLGAYRDDVFRHGLAAIAELDANHLPTDETESLERVLEVIQTVLANADDTEMTGHAIRAFGVIAATRPDWTATWVANNYGERHLYRFNEQVETTLTEMADTDELVSLLQTVAVLVSHDRLSVLVATLPRRVLENCATVDEYRSRTWIHVICRELGYDSPVDPADVWVRIENERHAFGMYRWLLVTYSVGEIPGLDPGPDAAAVVIQKQRHIGITQVATLPESLVNTNDLIDQLMILATRDTDGYPGIQKRAAKSLGAIASSPRLSVTEATQLVEHFESVVDDHDRRVQKPALAGLKQLAVSDGIPSRVRLRAVEVITTAMDTDHAGVRHTALKELGTMLTLDTAALTGRVREMLETALDHADPVVRATAAWELVRSEGTKDGSDLTRTEVVAPLERALDSDDAEVRELAIERSKLLASSTVVPVDLRQGAICVLERAMEADTAELRRNAARGLGEAADTTGQSSNTHWRIFSALETALDDPATKVLEAAANALKRQAAGETTPPELCERAIPTLGSTLRNSERFDAGAVAGALVEWTGRAAVSDAVSDTIVTALTTAFEASDGNDRNQVVQGTKLLLQADSTSLSPLQRSQVRDLLCTAVRDENQFVREEAVAGLTAWAETATSPADGDDEVVRALQSQLDAESPDTRLHAGDGLSTIAASGQFTEGASDSAADSMASMLEDDDLRVRVAAALNIIRLSSSPLITTARLSRSLDVLQAAQQADNPAVRLYILDRLEALVVEEASIETHGWVWTLYLTALEDDRNEIRERAARGIRDICERALPSPGSAKHSFVSDLGDALSTLDPAVTRHLLVGLRTPAENDPARLEALRAEIRAVLTEDAPVDVQITALGLLSLLGVRTMATD
jgi:hypothetical protein